MSRKPALTDNNQEEEENEYSSLSSGDIMYGYFDGANMFIDTVPIMEMASQLSKRPRLIQCSRRDKRKVETFLLECMSDNGDIIGIHSVCDHLVRYVANLSSEECAFLNLSSPVASMTIMDIDKKADEAGE